MLGHNGGREIMMARIITSAELTQALDQLDADKNELGHFFLNGTIVSFMGIGDEFIIYKDATYLKGGESFSLLEGLAETKHGLRIQVIGEEDESPHSSQRRPTRNNSRMG
jgi:hypothetical protein